jgi:pyruvate dehydrogenase E2 component (dihydrolipoamide acetyltransferase)
VLNALFAGAGDGPTLVFLHGLGGSQSTWQVVLGDLVDHHRTISIDLPGHGASDKSPDADYSVDGLATAVSAALATLKLDRPVLVGHSLGGAVALRIASRESGATRGVVAINSAGLGEEINSELTTLMAGDAGEGTARGLLRLFYEDQKLVADRGVAEMAQTQLVDGAWIAQQAVANAAFDAGRQRPESRVDPAAIPVPVALVWGELDCVIPLAHAVESLRLFADASLTLVPGVGHVPQVENASRTATIIRRFANSLD